MARRRRISAAVLIGAALLLAACDRENRNLDAPSSDTGPRQLVLGGNAPGGATPATPPDPRAKEYAGNATHLSNGQRYYQWFNCNGCHFNGGGGIGPALMDDKWRYGGSIENIYQTIMQGRPNGMPSFRGKIPEQQAWEIAAYVQSLSGRGDKLAASSRTEDMSSIPPVNHLPTQPPKGDPDAAGAPQ